MSARSFTWPVRIRFSDTDASGRIHYTALLRHFEAAEQEFLRSLGFHFTEAARAEVGFPRVHVECDYTGAVRNDDLVRIAVSVPRVGRTSYTLGFDAAIEGRPVANGRIVIVCMDLATERARPLPAAMAAALEAWARQDAT